MITINIYLNDKKARICSAGCVSYGVPPEGLIFWFHKLPLLANNHLTYIIWAYINPKIFIRISRISKAGHVSYGDTIDTEPIFLAVTPGSFVCFHILVGNTLC